MRVLGLIGSARRLGNTEILVKEALMGALGGGADVELVRLSDLKIKPCTGCMACVFKEVDCGLDDDLCFLLEQMQRADGIVLGAPVYFFGAPGTIKLIVDRFLVIKPGQFDGRKAVTLGVAGQTKWARLFMPQLNLLPLAAGYDVVASELFESPGPGEVLLDPDNIRRGGGLGRLLVASIQGETPCPRPVSRECPICHGTAFRLKTATRVECPLCYTEGEIVQANGEVAIRFDPEMLRFRYFGEETRADHFEHWVKRTGPRFRQHVREVLAARKRYENLPIRWLEPESGR